MAERDGVMDVAVAEMGNGDITLSRGKFELDSGVASPIGPSVECHLPTYFIELRTAKTEELKR